MLLRRAWIARAGSAASAAACRRGLPDVHRPGARPLLAPRPAEQLPGLRASGAAVAWVQLHACSMLSPHFHPEADEFLVVLTGGWVGGWVGGWMNGPGSVAAGAAVGARSLLLAATGGPSPPALARSHALALPTAGTVDALLPPMAPAPHNSAHALTPGTPRCFILSWRGAGTVDVLLLANGTSPKLVVRTMQPGDLAVVPRGASHYLVSCCHHLCQQQRWLRRARWLAAARVCRGDAQQVGASQLQVSCCQQHCTPRRSVMSVCGRVPGCRVLMAPCRL